MRHIENSATFDLKFVEIREFYDFSFKIRNKSFTVCALWRRHHCDYLKFTRVSAAEMY